MTTHPAAARPARPRPLAVQAAAALLGVVVLAACGSPPAGSQPPASGASGASGVPMPPSAGASQPASAAPSASASPTPLPTPQYTNPPDDALGALIPERVGSATVVVPPVREFAITPGDIGVAYGELGLRFTALRVAFVENPRLSLYAMRVAAPEVSTADLEPYLETAGQYVGIAGLVREPWELKRIGRRVVWVRPEDNATALGTMIYTWSAGDVVFLMIGVDDRLNRALFRALPGEPAAAASPDASGSPAATGTASPSPSAGS